MRRCTAPWKVTTLRSTSSMRSTMLRTFPPASFSLAAGVGAASAGEEELREGVLLDGTDVRARADREGDGAAARGGAVEEEEEEEGEGVEKEEEEEEREGALGGEDRVVVGGGDVGEEDEANADGGAYEKL